jgi:excisionase family DNA binding protein
MERSQPRPSVTNKEHGFTVDKTCRIDTLNWASEASDSTDAGTISIQDAGGQDPLLALLKGSAPQPRSKETPLPEAEMLTKKQAAAMLTVSVRTLDRLVSRGDIPHVVLGRRCVRFPQKALRGWIESRTKFRK